MYIEYDMVMGKLWHGYFEVVIVHVKLCEVKQNYLLTAEALAEST